MAQATVPPSCDKEAVEDRTFTLTSNTKPPRKLEFANAAGMFFGVAVTVLFRFDRYVD
jgi:hypothetical protein